MELHLVRDFGTGDIETIEISPAVLEIEVEPRMAGEADRILMVHSVPGRFAYITGPYPGRFCVEIGESGDLDRIGEALLEITELSGGSPPPYAVRDLYRRREETIVRKETDTIEDEIALGLYDDEDL
ncbi:hypothetical protein [Methanoculleus sp. 10]|uniref:hypothetical protein n=1 Tax=Methanoculleus sp. 10 TaxID=430615 RepID=UPI0025CBCB8F|nr:hypothetical protein [Methanoculleus sp. 10]